MVMRLKFTPYYFFLGIYCITMFLGGGALQTAANNIRDRAALSANADTYMRQDLVQLVAMKI